MSFISLHLYCAPQNGAGPQSPSIPEHCYSLHPPRLFPRQALTSLPCCELFSHHLSPAITLPIPPTYLLLAIVPSWTVSSERAGIFTCLVHGVSQD